MNLTGFLHAKYARIFMQELWDLLLSAQENIGGIPTLFLEKKKEEIRRRKVCLPTHVAMLHGDVISWEWVWFYLCCCLTLPKR